MADCFGAVKVPRSSSIIDFAKSTFKLTNPAQTLVLVVAEGTEGTRSAHSPADINSSQSSHSI